MDFVKVAEAPEIPPGTMKMFVVQGNEVLIANVEGKFYTIANKCTHQGGNLSQGKFEGVTVTCPRHGSRFDVTTGKSISGPKIGFLRLKTKDISVYEVKLDGTNVMVKI